MPTTSTSEVDEHQKKEKQPQDGYGLFGGVSFSVDNCDENININLFNQNDPDGFAAVYNRLSPYCIFMANRLVSPDEAVDVVADVFLKIWVLPNKKFSNIYHIQSFLKTCVKHRCFSILKKQEVRLRNESAWQRIGDNDIEMRLANEEIHAEKMTKIYNAIESLPPKTKRVFKMSFIDGMKNREIARELGVSEHTVVNQKYDALKELRKLNNEIS